MTNVNRAQHDKDTTLWESGKWYSLPQKLLVYQPLLAPFTSISTNGTYFSTSPQSYNGHGYLSLIPWPVDKRYSLETLKGLVQNGINIRSLPPHVVGALATNIMDVDPTGRALLLPFSKAALHHHLISFIVVDNQVSCDPLFILKILWSAPLAPKKRCLFASPLCTISWSLGRSTGMGRYTVSNKTDAMFASFWLMNEYLENHWS